MTDFDKFRQRTLKQIRLWAWVAAVLPITALAGIVFIWAYGTNTIFTTALVIGETTMFAVAVIWWWWAIFVINKLVKQWDTTRDRVVEVLGELRTIKDIIKPVESDK